MHICFIVEGYPTEHDPMMPFIRNTIAEMAKQGIQCSVIAPQSMTRALVHRLPTRPTRWVDQITKDVAVTIYQPKYISLSGRMARLNRCAFLKAARKAYKKVHKSIDVLYGHFWHMGVTASKLEEHKPIFVACGESKISVRQAYSTKEIDLLLDKLAGVIYVSSKSYAESVELGLQQKTPYVILPNGIDQTIFRSIEKQVARTELGWSVEAFVVAFVGAFVERKGVLRLSEALNQLNNHRVYACFIGAGEQQPNYKNTLFCGRLSHDDIARYLCASDIFVLPTLNEGCCNAIVEALACGLPVVSSDDRFNDDILFPNNSIRVDSREVDAIRDAIAALLEDADLCARLSNGALASARDLSLEVRAEKIISFIRDNMEE